jgi:hypothetical protein
MVATMKPDNETERLRKQRRDALVAHLPARVGRWVQWLLAAERRTIRMVAGVLFLLGGFLSFLPLLGIWMLPLGVVLLAEDIPLFRGLSVYLFAWMARRRPDLFGEQKDGEQ